MTTETDTLAGLAEACIDSILNISRYYKKDDSLASHLENAAFTEREASEVLWPRFCEEYVCKRQNCFVAGFKHYAGMFTSCYSLEEIKTPAAFCFWHAFLLQFLELHKEECHSRS